MKITKIIFSILLFYSCTNRINKKIEKNADYESIKTDKISLEKECIQKDTITASGTEIKYLFRDGKYKISYGNRFYNRTYDSLYTCDFDKSTGELWDFVPKFESETKNNLIFKNILWTSSGANPAPLEYYAIVFPKNKKDNPFQKEFFITCKDDYLVYGNPENENIHIINLETKKTQLINLKPKPYLSRSPTLSIQETKIEKKVFFIKYESIDNNDEIITVEKTFKIEI